MTTHNKNLTTEAQMLVDKLYDSHIEDLMCELLGFTVDDYRGALEELTMTYLESIRRDEELAC